MINFFSFPDFWIRALCAGIMVAIVAAPLGSVMVWRKMAYFSDALSHSGLLGVSIAIVLGIQFQMGVLICAVLFALLMLALERYTRLASDTLLGILSHTTLALGLVIVSLTDKYRLDLLSFLYGDILSVSSEELLQIALGSLCILFLFKCIWRSLISLTLHREMAEVEGVKVNWVHTIYVLLLAAFIAGAMKMVGILLITALLVIPPATARRFAKSPESVIWMAGAFGVTAVILGLLFSLKVDVPTGPAIVVFSSTLFGLSLLKKL